MDIDIKQQGGDASELTLGEIRDLLKKQVDFSESIWIDATDTYCVRRVSYSEDLLTYTISYTLADGSAYAPTLPLEPASAGADREVVTETYTVITDGTGYSISDIVQQARVYDTNLGTILSTIWYNQTTDTVITPAPKITDLTPEGSIQSIASATGTQADVAYAHGDGTIISILKGIFGRLGFSQNAGATDATTLRTTQSSNSPLVTSTGGIADAAYVSGSGTLIAILKGIFGKLTLGQTTMTASLPVAIASNQTAVAISAATLPLPSGAATEATLSANGVLVGAVTETAPATDTASSGLNGRLQRIAQRLGRVIPPAATQSTVNFYVAATVTVDQNSAATGTTPATGGNYITVCNNSGVICDITTGGTSGGADGTTILTIAPGEQFSSPINIADSVVIRVKPRVSGLASTDIVAVRIT